MNIESLLDFLSTNEIAAAFFFLVPPFLQDFF